MAFHLIGTACIVATMNGGIHVHPVCQEIKGTKDYATYAQCMDAVNSPAFHPAETPTVPEGHKRYTMHCIEE